MSSLTFSKGLFSNKTLPTTQDSNNRVSIISTKQSKIINNNALNFVIYIIIA